VTLEIREIGNTGDIQIRTLPCRVERVEKPAADVAILYGGLPVWVAD